MIQVEVKLDAETLAQLAKLIGAELRGEQSEKPATYSEKEVAELLGVSTKTVRRRIDAGLIQRVPNLHSVRIPAEALDAFLKPSPTNAR